MGSRVEQYFHMPREILGSNWNFSHQIKYKMQSLMILTWEPFSLICWPYTFVSRALLSVLKPSFIAYYGIIMVFFFFFGVPCCEHPSQTVDSLNVFWSKCIS